MQKPFAFVQVVLALIVFVTFAFAQPPTKLTPDKGNEMGAELRGLAEAYHQEQITLRKHYEEDKLQLREHYRQAKKALEEQHKQDREAIRSRYLAIPTPPMVVP